MQQAGVPEFRLVCIVGASRSGTTMMNRVLGSHSRMLGFHELHFIGRRWHVGASELLEREQAERECALLLATARRDIWNTVATPEERQEAARILACCPGETIAPQDVYRLTLSHLMVQAGKDHVIDQTPRNLLYATDILAAFPQARIVHMSRDPRAVLYSQYNRWKHRLHGATNNPLWNMVRVKVNYHPFTTTRLWIAAEKAGKALAGDSRYLHVNFEAFVRDPEAGVRRICQFLGVDVEPAMLDVPHVGSSNRRHDEGARGISSSVADSWQGKLPVADLWICEQLVARYLDERNTPRLSGAMPLAGVAKWLLLYPLHALGVLVMNPGTAARVMKILLRKNI